MRQKLDALERGIFDEIDKHKSSVKTFYGEDIFCICGTKIATAKQERDFRDKFQFDKSNPEALQHPVQINFRNHIAIELAKLMKEVTGG